MCQNFFSIASKSVIIQLYYGLDKPMCYFGYKVERFCYEGKIQFSQLSGLHLRRVLKLPAMT